MMPALVSANAWNTREPLGCVRQDFVDHRDDFWPSVPRVTGAERRIGVIFNRELRELGIQVPAHFRSDANGEVDARSYATAAHEPAVVVFDETIRNANGAIFGQFVDEGPVTGASLTVENAGCGEYERSIAHRRNVFGAFSQASDLRQILRVHRRRQI